MNDPFNEKIAGDSKVGGKVFATDSILSTLMCASRSELSRDIVCTKVGTGAGAMLFFDTRDESNIDYLTVNETAWEPPTDKHPESIDSKSKLSLEATMINQNFTQQILNLNNVKSSTIQTRSLMLKRTRTRNQLLLRTAIGSSISVPRQLFAAPNCTELRLGRGKSSCIHRLP